MPRHPTRTTAAARRRTAGFSLVEACAVIAIVAVVATSAAPSLQSLIQARRLDGSATELVTDIQLARSEAVARNLPVRLTLQTTANGSCYLLHTGDAGDCTCAASGPTTCTSDAVAIKTTRALTADHIAFASRTASLLFDPLHGTSTPAATLRVLGIPGQEIDQVVNVMGRVRSCSPHAAVAGYRTC